MIDRDAAQEALKKINTIKEAIDRTTGAQTMMEFIRNTGWMFTVFGIAILLGGIVSGFLLKQNPAVCGDVYYECWMGYFCLLVSTGIFYAWFQLGKLDHTRMIRSYIQLYLALDSLMIIVLVFLIYKHMVVFAMPFLVTIIGVTFVVFSATTFIKQLMYVGYEFLLFGAVGLFFIEHHFLAFTCLTLGLNPILLGVYFTVNHEKISDQKKNHLEINHE